MSVNRIIAGAAYMAGSLPLYASSIEKAIRLNGVSVEMNLLAFRWGRMAVVDRVQVEAAVAQATTRASEQPVAPSAVAQALVDRVGASGRLRRPPRIPVAGLIAFT